MDIDGEKHDVELSLTISEDSKTISVWMLSEIDEGSLVMDAGTLLEMKDGSFEIHTMTKTVKGTFIAPDKVTGTYEFSYGDRGTYTGEWEGSPKR